MSTESGLRDFRSSEGWWQNYNPKELASIQNMKSNYPLFHQFYSMRIEELRKHEPHKGHAILAHWEQKGLIHGIATQTVDGYHQKAGSRRVFELHGRLDEIRCVRCGRHMTVDMFLGHQVCSHCSGHLRPGVVLFGERLPQDTWQLTMKEIMGAELVIVIGTSLTVYPVADLPTMSSGKTVYINMENLQTTIPFHMVFEGSAGHILEAIDQYL